MNNITSFLQKSFESLDSSIIFQLNKIGYCLVKGAMSISYIETLGEHADSFHIWVKSSYEEDFKLAFEHSIRKAINKLHVSYDKLAFNITHEPFYGKTRGLYTFDTPKEKHDG